MKILGIIGSSPEERRGEERAGQSRKMFQTFLVSTPSDVRKTWWWWPPAGGLDESGETTEEPVKLHQCFGVSVGEFRRRIPFVLLVDCSVIRLQSSEPVDGDVPSTGSRGTGHYFFNVTTPHANIILWPKVQDSLFRL